MMPNEVTKEDLDRAREDLEGAKARVHEDDYHAHLGALSPASLHHETMIRQCMALAAQEAAARAVVLKQTEDLAISQRNEQRVIEADARELKEDELRIIGRKLYHEDLAHVQAHRKKYEEQYSEYNEAHNRLASALQSIAETGCKPLLKNTGVTDA